MLRFLLALCLLPSVASAQSFVQPIDTISSKTSTVAVLADGTEVEGSVKAYTLMNGSLRSFALKTDAGEKHAMKAAMLTEVRHEPGKLARFAAVMNYGDSFQSWLKGFEGDFEEIMNRKEVLYRSALLPKKNDVSALLQLLNPGFDRTHSVFVDPAADSAEVMGMKVNAMTFLVSKGGAKTVRVKKVTYAKDFAALFADCAPLMEMVGTHKPKIDDMALHVWVYDRMCAE